MKSIIVILSLFISLSAISQEMNIITYNIRLNTASDGENAWTNRKEAVADLLKFHDVDIFGIQEALLDQMQVLENLLPDFKWIGVGRDDGKNAGEFSPLFYNNTKIKVIDQGWFWLAEDCNKPVLGWDAACKRICTWAIMKVKQSNKQILVLNTHFDHKGNIAREESAKLILDKIQEINTKNLPVVLTGDFNLSPDSKPIQKIKTVLNDSKEKSLATPYGPEGTFNGFNFNHPLDRRIDYIFVNDKVKVLKYAVLSDSKNLHYPSDHLPVFIKIKL